MLKKIDDPIALVIHNLGPYHVARINELIKSLTNLHIIELANRVGIRDWKRPNCSGFHLLTLFDGDYFNADTKLLANKVRKELNKISPKCVIVASYSHPAMRAAFGWARNHNVKTVLFSESQNCDRSRYFIKDYFKSIWLRKYATAIFASGARAANYLESIGYPESKIWRGYSVIDNRWFSEQADQIRIDSVLQRNKLGLPDKYFLYVGRFSKEKNLIKLLEAYKKYKDSSRIESWDLVLLGSGPQETYLKEMVDGLNIDNVIWPGFKQLEALPKYYALASAFVLPSIREPWGLVVNEAMASGLPVLVSSRCGCTLDLVFPGVNGWIIDPLSIDSISNAMKRVTLNKNLQLEMGGMSREIVDKYTLENWTISLVDCISILLNQSVDRL